MCLVDVYIFYVFVVQCVAVPKNYFVSIEGYKKFTWGSQAIMFINIRIEIRRNDRLSAAQ